MLKVRQFITLAALTAVEALRQPICLLLAATCVIIIALTPLLQMHHFGEDGKLARDSGLALHFVFGLFIAGYTASSCLGKEIRRGTASAVLSKPISREVFFLSKYAGIAAVIIIFSLCASISTLLAERVAQKFVYTKELVGFITDWTTGWMLVGAPFVAFLLAGLLNYRSKRPFESTAFGLLLMILFLVLLVSGLFARTGAFKPYDLNVHAGIIPVSIMITMALLVISSIAITLSVRLGIVPTLTICSAVFMLGLMSDYLFAARALESGFFKFIYNIIPNWQHFWKVDALRDGGTVPWVYTFKTIAYAAAYSAGILCMGMMLFSRKELD